MTQPGSARHPGHIGKCTLTVNGDLHDVDDVAVGASVLNVLRDQLGLLGTKNACEQGECGSCAVIVDNRLLCSCLMPATTMSGRSITTIEGFGTNEPTDVQRAMAEAGAVQCGFCTPGLVVTAHHLLDGLDVSGLEALDRHAISEAISGNLCRCTGYQRIIDAIENVARTRLADLGCPDAPPP